MTSNSIITWFDGLKQFSPSIFGFAKARNGFHLRYWAAHTDQLPRFVRHSLVAQRYLNLLSPLAWDDFPKSQRHQNGNPDPISYRTFAASYLIKLDQNFVSMGYLRRYLAEHPELVWLLGFPLSPSRRFPWGFDSEASLPTQRHFTRVLRQMPNSCLQFLLDSSVALLQNELAQRDISFGKSISLDTKHILAWVAENNPKAYFKERRFDKTRQPKGDRDCKLGCKRRRNQRASSKEPPPTPPDNPVPANTISIGEYYWGYASGVVATKVPEWGEIVLAELTLPFDQPDVAYFFPLMEQTQRRLGFKPRYAAFDAAFDAWYVYEYFHSQEHDGFAAVPFSKRGGYTRQFDDQGLPLCQANFAMPLKYVYNDKKAFIPHKKGRYVCPLLYPETTDQACPIKHKQWPKGGCTTTLPLSIGARLRYQLDRDSDLYKRIYKQRTATERINSQAKHLGIEQPKLRNQNAITNLNTLIYTLINLRTWHRIRRKLAKSHTPPDNVA